MQHIQHIPSREGLLSKTEDRKDRKCKYSLPFARTFVGCLRRAGLAGALAVWSMKIHEDLLSMLSMLSIQLGGFRGDSSTSLRDSQLPFHAPILRRSERTASITAVLSRRHAAWFSCRFAWFPLILHVLKSVTRPKKSCTAAASYDNNWYNALMRYDIILSFLSICRQQNVSPEEYKHLSGQRTIPRNVCRMLRSRGWRKSFHSYPYTFIILYTNRSDWFSCKCSNVWGSAEIVQHLAGCDTADIRPIHPRDWQPPTAHVPRAPCFC